jgi:hypothetical protein
MKWIFLLVTSCSTPAILNPPSGNGCRLTEHECMDHACCLENFSCGGDDPACPINECCYLGPPAEGIRNDAGIVVGPTNKRAKRIP